MQYKIIVDKQSRLNPSGEQREYIINTTEELRTNGVIYDTIIITQNRAYIERKLKLNEYKAITELQNPIIEELGDLDIKLFDGDNYIYLVDMIGNNFYAEYVIKNDFTDTFVTNIQMNTAINQTAQEIMLSVNKKVDGEEFGTYIQQNSEAIKFAWNQISEFIQLIILNNNASFAILDKDKKVIMALDKEGQHFYKDGKTVFGEMGVQNIDNERFISFSVEGDYERQIENGMAWGIKTKSDGKFYPILSIRNFAMGPKNSDASYGELELSSCNLVLNGFGTGIKTGGVLINGDPGEERGVFFVDINKNKNLLSISPDSSWDYANIAILDNISFYKNKGGNNSFRVGKSDNEYCIMTDEGLILCNTILASGSINADGYVSGIAFINNSRIETKKNIKKYNKSAIKEILNTDIYEFNYKTEKDESKKHIGFIIDEKYKYSQDITAVDEEKKEIGVNTYSMISVTYKAIQEQQEQIHDLQEKNKQKDNLIENLTKRIEILEKEALNGKD